ncbi:hypothetical protein MNBD_GAMMA05-1214 [hydrothermal vent metagenome]|uniref:PEP-CTERM protein-sorting domain-containing protein n=1 Tax=hydrothermal vent metagenome TaxID=652676 RepID=A0A3B0WEK0_9ZZZZ
MKIKQRLKLLVLSAILLIPGVSSAEIIKPALDIQNFAGDSGVTLTGTTFDIDSTVFTIVTDGAPIDIDDVNFLLTSVGSFLGGTGIFSGSFTVGGGLLTGTFTDLTVLDFGGGDGTFGGDVTYTGGSLQGSLVGGRIEGGFSGYDVAAKLGEVAVVPVPAAVWLFGSGLLGLVGIARRKA